MHILRTILMTSWQNKSLYSYKSNTSRTCLRDKDTIEH